MKKLYEAGIFNGDEWVSGVWANLRNKLEQELGKRANHLQEEPAERWQLSELDAGRTVARLREDAAG